MPLFLGFREKVVRISSTKYKPVRDSTFETSWNSEKSNDYVEERNDDESDYFYYDDDHDAAFI